MKTIFELTTVMLLYAAACPAGVLYQTAPQPASYVFNGNYGDSEINNWQWLATDAFATQAWPTSLL